MRFLVNLLCAAMLGGTVAAAPAKPITAAHPAPPQAAPAGRAVPDAFAGWVEDGAAKVSADAAQADGANAAALKEYGLQKSTEVTYKRDGETLTVKALQFGDVSGAFGAYSLYRGGDWAREEIGQGAAAYKNRVIFWRGTTVVDANFSAIHPESGSELRELAEGLPEAQGNKALLPPILDLLPKSERAGQTSRYAKTTDGLKLLPGRDIEALVPRYAEGPAGYVSAGGVLPAELIGFDLSAETVTATYPLSSNPATLTLIEYPTPQMAMAAETKIRSYIQAGAKAQPPFTKALQDSDQASLEVRRSGPIVALVSGDAIPDESHRLIEMVHYSSDVTRMPMPGISEIAKTGSLLMGIATLVIIGGSAAILLGFFLGGGRALYRKMRGKPVSSVYDAEFTRLDLRD